MKKNRIIKIFIIFMILLAVSVKVPVKAKSITNGFFALVNNNTCEGYLGSPTNPEETAYWIQMALNVLRYVAIIILIVMSSLDFIKALVAQNNDALKKALTTFTKRLIYCVLIFFVPVVVKLIMGFLGAYGTCGIN